jgi:hypothetical protein
MLGILENANHLGGECLVPRVAGRFLISALIALAMARAGRSDELFSPTLHPWGNCTPGAWKMVRVVTKCLNESGAVSRTNTTETKTTLLQLDDKGATLQVNAVVEFLGKRFETDGQSVRQGFHGEPDDPNLKIRPLAASSVTIDGERIPCSVAELELSTPECKTVTTLHYSPSVAPYILKRESLVTDVGGQSILGQTTTEVVAFNMPCEVLSDVKTTAQVQTVYKHPNGTITTLSFVSPEVPGGVVAYSSKELDKEGHLTRISVLKLVGYSFEPEDSRPGLFGHKRSTRFRVYGTPPSPR